MLSDDGPGQPRRESTPFFYYYLGGYACYFAYARVIMTSRRQFRFRISPRHVYQVRRRLRYRGQGLGLLLRLRIIKAAWPPQLHSYGLMDRPLDIMLADVNRGCFRILRARSAAALQHR